MKKSRLNGKRGVPLLRCSTMEQADTSIDDQLNSIKFFADERNMELGDPVKLVGKSGSIKTNLEAGIDEIIARKNKGERIDYVVYYDQSRFARSGAMHFGSLAERLDQAGIDLAETDGFLEDPEMNPLMRTFKAVMSQQYSKTIADNSARGSQSSLRNGRRTHTTLSPYGIDKLRMTPEGKPEYIIRRLTDGTRLFLDPDSKEVRHTYLPGVRLPQKAPLGRDTLVPGDPAIREIIVRIFRMHHEDGWGGQRIGRALNAEGIPSSTGRSWTINAINELLRNEVYTGIGYANRYCSAIYVNQAEGRPEPLVKPQGKVIRGIRPSDKWFVVKYPELEDFLPPELKLAAQAEQAAYRDRIKTGRISSPRPNNGRLHHLLSGVMTEKSSGKAMTAIVSGNLKRLYYWLGKENLRAPDSSPQRRRIPALPLHRAVLEEIETLICSLPDLRERIMQEILNQDKARRIDSIETGLLIKEMDKLKLRYKSQLNRLGGPDDDAVNQAIDETTNRIRTIEDRLLGVNAGPALTESQVESVADGIIRDLSTMLAQYADQGEPALRELAKSMISSAVADLAAEEVRFEFAVPAELIHRRVISLPHWSGSAPCRQAYKWEPIYLHAITIEVPKRCNKYCWEPFRPQGCEECLRQGRVA